MVAEASKSVIYDVSTFRSGEAVGALVGLARKALAEEFERELAPLGLNVAQALVILFLADGRAFHGQLTRVQVDVLNKMLRGFTKSEARTLEALLKRILGNANGAAE